MTDNSSGGPETWPDCPLPCPTADPVQCVSEICVPSGAGDATRGHLLCGRERNTTGEGVGTQRVPSQQLDTYIVGQVPYLVASCLIASSPAL